MAQPLLSHPVCQRHVERRAGRGGVLADPPIRLADGTALMPLAFFRDIKVDAKGNRTVISYRQSEMDRMGANRPIADDSHHRQHDLFIRTEHDRSHRRLHAEAEDRGRPGCSGAGIVFRRCLHGRPRHAVRYGAVQVTSRSQDCNPVSPPQWLAMCAIKRQRGLSRARCAVHERHSRCSEPLTISWRLRYQAE